MTRGLDDRRAGMVLKTIVCPRVQYTRDILPELELSPGGVLQPSRAAENKQTTKQPRTPPARARQPGELDTAAITKRYSISSLRSSNRANYKVHTNLCTDSYLVPMHTTTPTFKRRGPLTLSPVPVQRSPDSWQGMAGPPRRAKKRRPHAEPRRESSNPLLCSRIHTPETGRRTYKIARCRHANH